MQESKFLSLCRSTTFDLLLTLMFYRVNRAELPAAPGRAIFYKCTPLSVKRTAASISALHDHKKTFKQSIVRLPKTKELWPQCRQTQLLWDGKRRIRSSRFGHGYLQIWRLLSTSMCCWFSADQCFSQPIILKIHLYGPTKPHAGHPWSSKTELKPVNDFTGHNWI